MNDKRPTLEAYNAFVLRHTWRNLWANAADGIFYAMGLALAHPNTVLPGFVNDTVELVPRLIPYKNTLVGLLGFVISICFMMPQQIWAAHMTDRRAYLKPLLVFVALLERLPWLVMGVMTALVAPANPELALYLFLAVIFAYQFILGLVSPVWQEAVAKMTPVNKRGLLFGVREAIGGGLGVATLVAARLVVSDMKYPANYVWLFSGMFVLTFISWTTLFFLREMPYPYERKARPLSDFLGDIYDVVRNDRSFLKYFIARGFFGLAGVASSSFFVIRAGKVLNESAVFAITVNMTYVVMLGRISSIFFGPLGDRYGHRLLLAVGNLLTAAGIAAALFATSEPVFYAAYALSTFGMMSFWCGHSNYILELAPLEKRPAYISLDNMSGLPFVLAPLAGGWVADLAGGYGITFGAGIVFCLVGTLLFFFYAVDPRKTLRTDIVA